MYTIAKKFKFDSAHQLTGLPEGHKCGNMHGHTYTVEVQIWSNTLTKEGFVVDFTDLAFIKRYIDDNLDHKFLNEVLGFQTTSENLARHFHWFVEEWLVSNGVGDAHVKSVRVSETESTWAEYAR